jgi:hypothetical protein
MSRSSLWLVAAGLLCGGPAMAQDQLVPPALAAPSPQPSQPVPAAELAPQAQPPALLTRDAALAPADCSLLCKEITAQLQFGFPAGLRLQLPFAGKPNHYTVAEVFLGTEWTVLTATAGVRTIFEMPFQDPHNAFVLGPGVHAIFFNEVEHGHSSGGGGLVDMTIGWVFDRHAGGCCECGFNLGLALVVSGHDVFPLPTFGIYGGFHF